MVGTQKTVTCPVYKDVDPSLSCLVRDLVSTKALQRLGHIRQMFELSHTRYGNRFGHNRLQHSLDVLKLSAQMLASLDYPDEVVRAGAVAGLWHDTGHAVGAHTGETALRRIGFQFDHDVRGLTLLMSEDIRQVLQDHGVPTKHVAAVLGGPPLFKKMHYLEELRNQGFPSDLGLDLHNPEDVQTLKQWSTVHSLVQDWADMLSYLRRDFAHTEDAVFQNALESASADFVASLVRDGRTVRITNPRPFITVVNARGRLYQQYSMCPRAAITRELLYRILISGSFAIGDIVTGTDRVILRGMSAEDREAFEVGTDVRYPMLGVVRFPVHLRESMETVGLGTRAVVTASGDFSRRYVFRVTSAAQEEAQSLLFGTRSSIVNLESLWEKRDRFVMVLTVNEASLELQVQSLPFVAVALHSECTDDERAQARSELISALSIFGMTEWLEEGDRIQ
jgi:hypothetical protein